MNETDNNVPYRVKQKFPSGIVVGATDVENVSWNITLTGLVIPKKQSNTISLFFAGKEETLSMLVLGIGKTTITMNVGYEEKNATGFVLLFFVFGVK